MGYLEDLEAQRKGYEGGAMSPGDPGYGSFLIGRNRRDWEDRRDAEAEWEPAPPTTATSGPTVGGYFQTLIGAPIGIGLIVGVVTLLLGGDYVRAALISGGATFVLLLVPLAIAVAIILVPLAIVAAIILYLLDLIGVGPGLPT